MNASEILEEKLNKIVKRYGIEKVKYTIETPDSRFGDLSTNLAMVGYPLVKAKFQSPKAFAEDIVNLLKKDDELAKLFNRIEVQGPGFINLFFSKQFLITMMIHIIKAKDTFGTSRKNLGKKIMIEFTDPNPFKEFHIGHLYSNTVGESLARLLESQGAVVKRANYQGDVGVHVAKAVWGMMKKVKSQKLKVKSIEELEKESISTRIKFLGEAYAMGAREYEESEEAKKEIDELNKKTYSLIESESSRPFGNTQGGQARTITSDEGIEELYKKGRQWSLEYFEEIYKRLGTTFDYYYFESEVGEYGLDIVKRYLQKDIFEESEGAIIFPGKTFGLHNRVFINSAGLPTYEAKELGLAFIKQKDFDYDTSIIVTGNEIIAYFKVLLKALSLIDQNLAEKTQHIAHGMVRLPAGKMSSRTGEVVTGEWLLDETKSRMLSSYSEMDQETAEKVAVGAVKYALLKNSIGHDVVFDFNESISLEGNSGPYLQYTYVRTQSVIKRSKRSHGSFFASSKIKDQRSKTSSKLKVLASRRSGQSSKFEPEEIMILRTLTHFENVIEKAAESFAPNLLCNYLFDLAQKFNLFYQKHPILKNEETREFRLALTAGVGQVIKNGLKFLGIPVVDKM